MQRSILALVALVAFAIGSSAAYACGDSVAGSMSTRTLASADGMTPIPVPASDDGS